MTLEDELVAEIAANPDDQGPRLVMADWLSSLGDLRGELIMLDDRDRATPAGLTDPQAVDRLLLLAAQYGFPHPKEHQDEMLPFVGDRFMPHYELRFRGYRYGVYYRDYTLTVAINDGAIDTEIDYPDGFDLDLASGDDWTEEEAHVILQLLSDAIRAGAPLAKLCFPWGGVVLPVYEGAPRRAYALPLEFTAAHGFAGNQHGLAARDYHRWHALWHRRRANVAAERFGQGGPLMRGAPPSSPHDPRWELKALDERDREAPGGLTELADVERLLILSTEYGFPHPPDLDDMLPFRGGGNFPVQYEVQYGGHHYAITYRHRKLSVAIDGGAIDSGITYPRGVDPLVLRADEWSDHETQVILRLLGDAIRAGTPLAELWFPFEHAPPTYPDAPVRAYLLPLEFMSRCNLGGHERGLAARDYHRWYALWHRWCAMKAR